MGLIKAAMGSLSSTMADQWKEYFYCDSMPKEVLVMKGRKRIGEKSSNTKGSDNIISNGSVIAVNEGQCMMIIEQGKIVDVCADPGEFVYDSSTEPSLFAGSLGDAIKNTFATIGKRFTFGGDTAKDQRVYYFNLKEIMENKFGTANPIPFRVLDRNIGLDIDVSVRCSGVYSYKITDPLLFYTNVCSNVVDEFRREEIEVQLKTEFVSKLQPAFGKISEEGIRPSALPSHAEELCALMNEALSATWSELRGISVVNIAMNPITLPEEDAEMIKQAQRTAIMRDPTMAAATLVGAQADAMKTAAGNPNGAMMGFMGMGMAAQSGGMNAGNLFAMGQQQQMQAQQMQVQQAQAAAVAAPAAPAQAAPAGATWKCSCGAENTGKFCIECGSKQPEPAQAAGWTCSCGAVNQGKFCPQCGGKKPADAPLYKCDKCGWQPEDPKNPPKFCPECGDVFDDNDITN